MKSCEPSLQREISTREPANAEQRRVFFDKPSFSAWRLCLSALLCGTAFVSDIVVAQTQIPLPAATGTFSGNSRGFWFTSPSNIVITGVRVPTDASASSQSVEIMRFNTAAPPLFSATTNDFTSLLRVVNDATTNILPASIPVATGDIIGVLGSRGDVNSYATGAPHASTIDGLPVSLARLGLQFALSTTAAQQLWTEASGSISRVELYYLPGFLVSTAASPLAGGTVTCAVNVVATGGSTTCTATPNAGYSLTNISGCNGTTSTTSPYTTGAVTAACTVTATFANALTIGGSVSGLSGTGLVLSLNAGAQTLSVAADGSFTFPTGVSSGSPYAVTVQTQPTNPSQTCAIANANGTTASSNVTDVTVTCTTNTYTVGGTVSGLSGSGLVLSLNAGAQTLNVSANGSVTFPTALASGSAYAVTVQTQPNSPTQTCSVANGSGTVVASNVTDVTVTCSTNTYSVGGSVSGLSGSGLVLSLNSGAQTLPVAADGSFTFPTALASGSAYAVTVQTQPSGPAQVCAVANGSGTLSNTNVTNVSVTCATAQRSVSVISSGAAFTTSPTIPASVPDGTVLTFTIVIPSGAQLQSVTGCGGSLNGSVYTTGPITANCTITVLALTPAIPTLNNVLLLLLAALVVAAGLRHRRTLR